MIDILNYVYANILLTFLVLIYIIINGTQKGGETLSPKKQGRPKKNKSELLSHDVKVRLNADTYSRLFAYSMKNNMTVAGVIRKAILDFLDSH